MTPFPNSPPIRNAAFFSPGITATHSALLHESSEMPLSGAARSSRTTVAASSRRFVSPDEMSANTVEVHVNNATANATMVFIGSLQNEMSLKDRCSPKGALFNKSLKPMVHFVHPSAQAKRSANRNTLGADTDGLVMAIPLGGTIGWGTLFKRTLKETITDNCLGLAAQLAYYFFLSVFPALLVVVALTSVFPRHLLEQILGWFGSFTPPDVLQIVSTQIQLIAQSGHSGLLTFGALGALWSSSSAMSATIDTLNRAYGIQEARPWWRVQSLALVLTIIMSIFVLVAFTLVVAGPEIAEKIAARHGLGVAFRSE